MTHEKKIYKIIDLKALVTAGLWVLAIMLLTFNLGIPDYMIVLRLKFVLHCLVSIKRPQLKSNMLFRFNFLKVKTLYIDI